MDMPEVLGSRIARESCGFWASTGRKYVLTFERPIYDGIPERSALFPCFLQEEERGDRCILHAEYHDGSTEPFEGFAEFLFRFSARLITMVQETCDEEAN